MLHMIKIKAHSTQKVLRTFLLGILHNIFIFPFMGHLIFLEYAL